MANLFHLPTVVAVDSSGAPYAGAKLEFFLTGTATNTDTYTDAALTTPHTNPVVADSAGVFAPIYLDPTVIYKATLSQSDDTLIDTYDPYNEYGLSVATASEWQLDVTLFDINGTLDVDGGSHDISGTALTGTFSSTVNFTSPILQIIDTTAPELRFGTTATRAFLNYTESTGIFRLDSDGQIVFGSNNTTALTLGNDQSATFAGNVVTQASTASIAGLNIPHGTAPTAPVNGDIWTTTAGLFVRINGSTIGPLS